MPRKTARNKEEKVKIIPQDCVSNFKGEILNAYQETLNV